MTNGRDATILILSKLPCNACGNSTTALRLKSHLSQCANKVLLADTGSFSNSDQLASYVKSNHVSAVLGIHAFTAGRLLKDSKCPYALILGGTDVNELTADEEANDVMAEALASAHSVVCFHDLLQHRARTVWPSVEADKFVVISPSALVVRRSTVKLQEITCEDNKNTPFPSFESFKLQPKSYVCLVANLRPVKDVMFLLRAFQQFLSMLGLSGCLSEVLDTVRLVIVGGAMNKDYADEVQRCGDATLRVIFTGHVPTDMCQRFISDAAVCVNCSQSEGLSVALLEAMALGTCVVVRDIESNRAVVEHEKTGLVYHDETSLATSLLRLLTDMELSSRLSTAGLAAMDTKFGFQRERELYCGLAKALMDANLG